MSCFHTIQIAGIICNLQMNAMPVFCASKQLIKKLKDIDISAGVLRFVVICIIHFGSFISHQWYSCIQQSLKIFKDAVEFLRITRNNKTGPRENTYWRLLPNKEILKILASKTKRAKKSQPIRNKKS